MRLGCLNPLARRILAKVAIEAKGETLYLNVTKCYLGKYPAPSGHHPHERLAYLVTAWYSSYHISRVRGLNKKLSASHRPKSQPTVFVSIYIAARRSMDVFRRCWRKTSVDSPLEEEPLPSYWTFSCIT